MLYGKWFDDRRWYLDRLFGADHTDEENVWVYDLMIQRRAEEEYRWENSAHVFIDVPEIPPVLEDITFYNISEEVMTYSDSEGVHW